MFVVVILIYTLIALIEIIPMLRKGQKKEVALYIGLLSIALTISVLLSLGVKIPSVAKPIEALVEMIIK